MIRVISIFLLIIVVACKSNNASDSQTDSWEKLAMEKYGSENEVKLSPDKKYVLITGKEGISILYTVYETKNERVAKEGKLSSGYVSWYDTHRLELFETPGIIPSNKTKNDFIVVLEVDTNKKVMKSDLEGPNNN